MPPASFSIRPSFNVTTVPLTEFLDRFERGDIGIPPHQRGYCWTLPRQQDLIETVLAGMPIPSIIISAPLTRLAIEMIEDGRQRAQTLLRFRDGEFKTRDGRSYDDLSVVDRMYFSTYPLPILTYRNANRRQIIETFHRFQNGSALKTGERLFALSELSPLVRFACEQLLTPGTGLHDRASATWGNRSGEDKGRRFLLNACALIAGLAFGSGFFSKKMGDFEFRGPDPTQPMLLAREFDEETVTRKIKAILDIYEQVDARFHIRGKKQLNLQWDLGKITGYIAYSINETPEERWDDISREWVAYLVRTRETPAVLAELDRAAATSTRSWNARKWLTGCHHVMPAYFENPVPRLPAVAVPDSDDEDEDDDSSE
jgi:hypothetical protein